MTEYSHPSAFTEIPHAVDLAQPKERYDGWSPERQVVFLEALARTGNVKAAALYTGLSRESAYKLRRRPDARAFAHAWDAALIHARDWFRDELLDRGLNGWTEAVWHQGEEVGTRERWSAPLFLAALGRLDKMADGIDMDGKPARVAAANFDALLEGIAEGGDCTDLVEEIDGKEDAGSREADPRSSEEIMEILQLRDDHARIQAMAPEDIDVSDLDATQHESWGELDWARAARSGLLERSGILDGAEDELRFEEAGQHEGFGV